MLIAISGGYVLFYYLSIHFQNTTFCAFKKITTLPCPGCGMGRATLELFKGHFIHSFYLNPLSIPFSIAVIVSVCWIAYDLKTGKAGFYQFIRKNFSLYLKIILAITILSVWIWNIYRGI